MKNTPPTPPPALERIDSMKELGVRLACTPQHAGRLFVSGAIRAAKEERDARYFRSEDLDQLRANAVEAIARSCAKLSKEERELLAAGLRGDPLLRRRLNRMSLSVPQERMRMCFGSIFSK